MPSDSGPAPELNPTRTHARRLGVDLERLPRHVAIIMDGNGRWAEQRGLERILGHRQGYRTLREVVLAAGELGIPYLTVYAFSAENWKRPAREVEALMELIEEAIREELKVIVRSDIRLGVIGRVEELSPSLREALKTAIESTAHNTGLCFTLAINYGGRAEIVDAVKRIAREGIDPERIDEELVSRYLYAPDTPDPDLVIRTAGEMRWSNFLIWQAAYAELYVSAKLWPEFDLDELLGAVKAFQSRTRKFGGLV